MLRRSPGRQVRDAAAAYIGMRRFDADVRAIMPAALALALCARTDADARPATIRLVRAGAIVHCRPRGDQHEPQVVAEDSQQRRSFSPSAYRSTSACERRADLPADAQLLELLPHIARATRAGAASAQRSCSASVGSRIRTTSARKRSLSLPRETVCPRLPRR